MEVTIFLQIKILFEKNPKIFRALRASLESRPAVKLMIVWQIRGLDARRAKACGQPPRSTRVKLEKRAG